MSKLFPFDYQPLESDWPTKKLYKDWIKAYISKKKEEIKQGYAIKGNYGNKLSVRERKFVNDFELLFNAVMNNLDGLNRDTALLFFATERKKHINISDSYFIWSCDIICLKSDCVKKFGKL